MIDIQVPVNLDDPVLVKRYMQAVVEALGELQGLAEDVPNLTEVDAAITSIQDSISELTSTTESTDEALSTTSIFAKDSEFTTGHQELDIVFRDFDSVAWNQLQGKGQFTALGSEMTNAPFAVTGGTTYITYIDSALSLGGGVVQRVLMENTGVDVKCFYRTGNTFALALTNGWTQV